MELFEDKFKIDFTIISELDKKPQEKFSDDDSDSDDDDYDDSDDDGYDDDQISSSFDKRKKAALEHKKEILDENHNSKHGFKNIPQIKEICFKAKDNIDKSNAQVDEQNLKVGYKVDDSEIKISKLQDHDNNYDQSDREVIGQT